MCFSVNQITGQEVNVNYALEFDKVNYRLLALLLILPKNKLI